LGNLRRLTERDHATRAIIERKWFKRCVQDGSGAAIPGTGRKKGRIDLTAKKGSAQTGVSETSANAP